MNRNVLLLAIFISVLLVPDSSQPDYIGLVYIVELRFDISTIYNRYNSDNDATVSRSTSNCQWPSLDVEVISTCSSINALTRRFTSHAFQDVITIYDRFAYYEKNTNNASQCYCCHRILQHKLPFASDIFAVKRCFFQQVNSAFIPLDKCRQQVACTRNLAVVLL